MKRRPRIGLALAVLAALCLLGLVIWEDRAGIISRADPLSEEKDQRAVVEVVEEFGKRLQLVSLLAPADTVKKAIEENYGALLSPGLLETWLRDPQNAPGRRISSPWPDRIEVVSVTRVSGQAFRVEGEIIEVTSVEKVQGGAAAKRPISLTVEKLGKRWLIAAVSLGEYRNVEGVLYHNAQYGFTFSLPTTWEGYSIVMGTWSGTAIDGPKAGQVVETGPLVRIRHPGWTAEKPRQDIPIMVFTLSQWDRLQREFSVSAAPIGPHILGRNSKYVFALPPRYNYAFPEGFEEVEKILEENPLKPHEDARS